VPVGYTTSDNGFILTLHVVGGLGDHVSASVESQSTDEVVVMARLQQTMKDRPAIGVPYTVDVSLQSPLDGREVRDISGVLIQVCADQPSAAC
jgi:hypothetical protein